MLFDPCMCLSIEAQKRSEIKGKVKNKNQKRVTFVYRRPSKKSAISFVVVGMNCTDIYAKNFVRGISIRDI